MLTAGGYFGGIMRADRLLSLLMLLQSRGRMSARALAAELEVSERTIYRDVEALGAAGVPIYAEPGREGGYALLDSYRTTLTGLSEGEVRAFFMLSIPAPLADLGIGQTLKAALLKMTAALPAARRQDEERVRQRFYLDSTWWKQEGGPLPYLQTLQQAVWQDRRVWVRQRFFFSRELERVVEPYGLVAKAGEWFLVFAGSGRVRTCRVVDLLDVQLTTERFERPPDFDLAAFWQQWCAARQETRAAYRVVVRVAPALFPYLPAYFGERIRAQLAQAGPPDAQGWTTVTLWFEDLAAARARLLGLGGAVEVLEPEPLRLSLVDFAQQIVALYRSG